MTESPNEPKKRLLITLLRPKVAIPLGLFVLVLLSPVVYRGWNLGHIPDLGDPFPEEQLQNPQLPEGGNAWVNYQKAAEIWETQQKNDKRSKRERRRFNFLTNLASNGISVWKEPPAQPRSAVLVNLIPTAETLSYALNLYREALDQWKSGTGKNRYYIEERSADETIRSLADDSALAIWEFELQDPVFHTLAIAKAGQLASQGKSSESLDWMLAIYRYSRHLMQSGGTRNWTDAVRITQDLFSALDELLDDGLFTHEMMLGFLHELEQSHELTGDFEQALSDDYLVLKRRIKAAHEADSQISEEPEAGSTAAEKNRFKLYVQGEPQFSLRFLQHHFEYLKENLKKPVHDRVIPINGANWDDGRSISQLIKLYRDNPLSDQVPMTAEQMEQALAKAMLLRDVADLSELTSNPFLREDDAMLFESLRILVAAHAFVRRFPMLTDEKVRLVNDLNFQNQPQIEILPVLTLEELAADCLGKTPHDPYNLTLPLIITTVPDGTVFIFSSTSAKYARLAIGDPLESIEESDDRSASRGQHIYTPFLIPQDFKPKFKSLSFRLLPPSDRNSGSIDTQDLKSLEE